MKHPDMRLLKGLGWLLEWNWLHLRGTTCPGRNQHGEQHDQTRARKKLQKSKTPHSAMQCFMFQYVAPCNVLDVTQMRIETQIHGALSRLKEQGIVEIVPNQSFCNLATQNMSDATKRLPKEPCLLFQANDSRNDSGHVGRDETVPKCNLFARWRQKN